MNSQMIVRIDPELKKKVDYLAKSEGKNVSEVVRELLEGYVKERDIGAYVDDLWERIGGKLSEKGVGTKNIRKAIRASRGRNTWVSKSSVQKSFFRTSTASLRPATTHPNNQ